jgi:ketosteroid isomerase-like protein
VAADLALYKSAKFKINDDAQVHKATDNLYWCTATIDSDMWRKDGKEEKTTFRWTVLFEKKNGKWLIVHEHVSMPQA